MNTMKGSAQGLLSTCAQKCQLHYWGLMHLAQRLLSPSGSGLPPSAPSSVSTHGRPLRKSCQKAHLAGRSQPGSCLPKPKLQGLQRSLAEKGLFFLSYRRRRRRKSLLSQALLNSQRGSLFQLRWGRNRSGSRRGLVSLSLESLGKTSPTWLSLPFPHH